MFARLNQRFMVAAFLAVFASISLASTPTGCHFRTTRLIVGDGENSGAVVLDNQSAADVLVFSKMQDADGQESTSIESFPRLFKVKAGQSGILRVNVHGDQLPADRESQFWLYAKLFTPQQSSASSKLTVNYINRLKVFYRPPAVKVNMVKAIRNIRWTLVNGKLCAENPSPAYISMVSVNVNGRLYVVNDMIRPYERWVTDIAEAEPLGNLKWQAVNDYGAVVEVD